MGVNRVSRALRSQVYKTAFVLFLLGNQLGEAVDEVIEKMDSYGKKDILASFEDNEEPESGSEDEDDSEESAAEEEDGEDEKKDEGADELALELKGIGLSANSQQGKGDSEGEVI